MTRVINRLLSWLKWPTAVWLALCVPRLVRADVALVTGGLAAQAAPFWIGVASYLVLWGLVLRRRVWGSFLPTLSHELTHGLFALLTLHRITNVRATWRSGGELQYVGGRGNWLITISPYFFPLWLALLVVALPWLQPAPPLRQLLIGGIVGFEAVTMWRQVHREQTDLQRVGFVFAALLLPGALLLTYGAALTLAVRGDTAALRFVTTHLQTPWEMISALVR